MPILDFSGNDPLTDGRQSVIALAIRRGVVRHFRELDISLIAEFSLASGRRADLFGVDRKGRFVIVEIKSSIADLRADNKWQEYLAYCDRFFFATHSELPGEIFPAQEGLIIADNYGAEIIRESRELQMAGATRKALTLRFARSAADRLERVLAHCDAAGEDLATEILAGWGG